MSRCPDSLICRLRAFLNRRTKCDRLEAQLEVHRLRERSLIAAIGDLSLEILNLERTLFALRKQIAGDATKSGTSHSPNQD